MQLHDVGIGPEAGLALHGILDDCYGLAGRFACYAFDVLAATDRQTRDHVPQIVVVAPLLQRIAIGALP